MAPFGSSHFGIIEPSVLGSAYIIFYAFPVMFSVCFTVGLPFAVCGAKFVGKYIMVMLSGAAIGILFAVFIELQNFASGLLVCSVSGAVAAYVWMLVSRE